MNSYITIGVLFWLLISVPYLFRNHGKTSPAALPPKLGDLPPSGPAGGSGAGAGMTDGEVLVQIKLQAAKKRSNFTALIMLAISAVLFVALGAYQWSFEFAIVIALVIFIHECGHL